MYISFNFSGMIKNKKIAIKITKYSLAMQL